MSNNDHNDNRVLAAATGNFDLTQDLRKLADDIQSCAMTLRLVTDRIDGQANDNDD